MESQLPTQGLNPHPLSGGGGGERGKVLNTGQMEESQERIFKGKVGEGHGSLFVANSFAESFVLSSVHLGQISVFL